jgi:DNA-binding transcriptional MocR family regulator
MSGGCPSQFTACLLSSTISDGTIDVRIDHLKQVYSQRAEAYTAAIEKYLVPHGAKYNPCFGGYFFWVKLPEGLISTEVFKEAMADGVCVMEGTSCIVPEDISVEYDKFIRICLALETEDKAIEGIKRLGKVFGKLLKNQ